jgi:hypothetical protein
LSSLWLPGREVLLPAITLVGKFILDYPGGSHIEKGILLVYRSVISAVSLTLDYIFSII